MNEKQLKPLNEAETMIFKEVYANRLKEDIQLKSGKNLAESAIKKYLKIRNA